ncbi:MAG: PEP-utilizing enzyme [Oscillospiraceae bacterium]|nr:PEP-utilizing enzyme [Oscillospiraceae bacterium]
MVYDKDNYDLVKIGGKAGALARLAGVTDSIPAWFVVSANGDDRVEEDGGAEGGGEEGDVALALRGFTDGTLFAVRSSAAVEDGSDHSFAGQFETYLNIQRADVYSYVQKVRGSAGSERVAAYVRERGLGKAPVPAVLVQQMVRADSAGVAFGANPVTGDTRECIISAVRGLGDKLVDGSVDAETYTVRGGRVKRSSGGGGASGATSGEVGGGEIVGDEKGGGILSGDQCLEIARLCAKASKFFGRYQDIEWAYEGERLFLLQSRPITTLRKFTGGGIGSGGGVNGGGGANANADGGIGGSGDSGAATGINIWDNSNIAESYNGVTTPLTFSLIRLAYEHVYREMARAMNVSEAKIAENEYIFTHMLGLHGGQVYYNMLSWYKLVAILPGYKHNAKFMEQMMGVKDELPDGVRALLPSPSGGSLVGTAARLLWYYRKNDANVRAFYKLLNETITSVDLGSMTLGELAGYYRNIESKLLKHWDAPVINDFYAMIFYGLLRKRYSGGDETAFNALLRNTGDIISAEPAKLVREMAQIKARGGDISEKIAYYLDKFGDRCINELKLESETLNDNPETLYNAVDSYAAKLRAGSVAQVSEPEAPPLKGLFFNFLLKHTRRTIRNRENLRFERTRVFGQVRKIAKEFGMRLASFDAIEAQNDIFYLELEEILGYIEGTATTTDLKGLVSVRKAEYAQYDGAAPERFDTFDCVHLSVRHTVEKDGQAAASGIGEAMQGLGCCPGVVRGRARVISDPRGATILPGEILVAQRTDPGWIMLFPIAAGVLVEYGSLLSHAAIVVREMGIPAVVSVKGLFASVETGDLLELDGEKGQVTIIEKRD